MKASEVTNIPEVLCIINWKKASQLHCGQGECETVRHSQNLHGSITKQLIVEIPKILADSGISHIACSVPEMCSG